MTKPLKPKLREEGSSGFISASNFRMVETPRAWRVETRPMPYAAGFAPNEREFLLSNPDLWVPFHADMGHSPSVRRAIRDGWKMPPPVVEIPIVQPEKDTVDWDLLKEIMKAYGLKETGQEDENEKYLGLHVRWREDEKFLWERFVGGVNVWWREDINAHYVFPGTMKRMTTDEALLHCWPYREPCTLLQNFRSLGVRHVDVVHFFETRAGAITRDPVPVPLHSEVITDYTNVITKNFEGVRDSMIANLHAVGFPRPHGLDAEECTYCKSPVNYMCKVCGDEIPICNNKPECLHDHWKEVAEDEGRYPCYHAHDDFARQLFANTYMESKNADVYIETNKYASVITPSKRSNSSIC